MPQDPGCALRSLGSMSPCFPLPAKARRNRLRTPSNFLFRRAGRRFGRIEYAKHFRRWRLDGRRCGKATIAASSRIKAAPKWPLTSRRSPVGCARAADLIGRTCARSAQNECRCAGCGASRRRFRPAHPAMLAGRRSRFAEQLQAIRIADRVQPRLIPAQFGKHRERSLGREFIIIAELRHPGDRPTVRVAFDQHRFQCRHRSRGTGGWRLVLRVAGQCVRQYVSEDPDGPCASLLSAALPVANNRSPDKRSTPEC